MAPVFEARLPQLSRQALAKLPTPSFLIDEALLRQNLEILARVRREGDCHILLAQKAFSAFRTYPLLAGYLDGTTASGLYEARLGAEEMPGREVHCFSPAYTESDVEEIVKIADHMVFNSWSQWLRHREQALQAGVSCGLRLNPEYSEQEVEMYDPSAPGSRLGMIASLFEEGVAQGWMEGLEGLHFHTLCEQGAEPLAATWRVFCEKFAKYFPQLKWINMGGGHHITRPDYNLQLLLEVIHDARSRGLEVYLEPGEAIALNAGFLLTEVVDLTWNHLPVALLDSSAACHMPDVLEMPYRPRALVLPREEGHHRDFLGLPRILRELETEEAQQQRETAYTESPGQLAPEQANSANPYLYRLGGPTCLAGDVIGDYASPCPLRIGDRFLFCDMAIYSMVKTNTFNGMPLPSIYYLRENGDVECLRHFDYDEFKRRL